MCVTSFFRLETNALMPSEQGAIMTKDEALRLALEALEVANSCVDGYYIPKGKAHLPEIELAITAIKAALEAKDEQLREENESLHVENRRLIDRIETIGVPVGFGGFATTTTSQPDWIERERAVGYREGHRVALAQRTWVGLTDEEILTYRHLIDWTAEWSYIHFARAIEAAHGIKGEA